LPASQGQILAINVTAPANEVSVSVTDPNGTPILPLSPTSFTWNVMLATTGNYQIAITAIAGTAPKPYTLAIGLATPTPTPTRQP
jgi:type 1 fimbria pilin